MGMVFKLMFDGCSICYMSYSSKFVILADWECNTPFN